MTTTTAAFFKVVLVNVFLCGTYFLLAKFGQLVAVPPGLVTALWPPSGLAMAACLIWGWRSVTPALLIAAFLVNATFGGGFHPTLLSVTIAIGNSLQAVLGAWVLGRFDRHLTFDDSRSIGRFLLLTIPICLVAATLGNLGLLIAGVIGPESLTLSYVSWWLGDVLGVVIFLPMTLAFVDKRPLWRRRRVQVGAPLLATAILCGLVFYFDTVNDQDQMAGAFQSQQGQILQSLDDLNESNRKALELAAALVSTPDGLTPQRFSENVAAIRRQFPNIHSFNWLPLVPQSQLTRFARHQSQLLGRPFSIMALPGNDLSRTGWSAPIAMIEPLAGNEPALGRDLMGEPIRAAAMIKARDLKINTASGKITLVQDRSGPGGLLLNRPLVSDTGQVLGYIVAVINLRDIFNLITRNNSVLWQVLDLDDHTILGGTLPSSPDFNQRTLIQNHGVYLQQTFRILDRTYKIVLFRPLSSFGQTGTAASTLVLFLSLMSCAGLVLFMLMVSGNGERTRREVDLRTAQLRHSEERFNLIAETVNDVFWMGDVNLTRVDYISPNFERLWGQSCQSLRDNPLSFCDPIHPDDRQRVYQTLKAEKAAGNAYDIEFRLQKPDGTLCWILDTGIPIRDENGQVVSYAGTCSDITEIKQTQAELLALNQQLESLVEKKTAEIRLAATVVQHTGEGAVVTDPKAVILSVNPAFTTITGYGPAEAIGRKISMLRSDHHDRAFYQSLWDSLIAHGHWQGEIWNRRKDGDLFLERQSINAVKDETGRTTHYVAVFNDITEARSKDDRIQHMAFHDALTGLPNRLLLQDRLQQGIIAARRDQNRLALLFIDLDHFKEVNDNLGHNVGDSLLEQTAQRIGDCIRGVDTLARLGGDEFVVLMVDVDDPDDCAILAQKIIQSVGQPMTIAEHSLHIGTSIGISVYPDDGEDGITLMKCADTAMYAAKKSGRRGYSFFQTAMSEHSARRMEIQDNLRRAIARSELSLFYQAKIDVRSHRICGYEALLRWDNAQLGSVPPNEFIPIAEESGLIGEIGAWVIDEACRQLAVWRDAGLPQTSIAVNVSPRQMHDNTVAELILDAAQRHGLPCSVLEVELTESTVMTNPGQVIQVLQILRGLGVRVAVDDFGTGYSSLAYLRRLPIDVLKIDRSFVMDADKNSDDAEIVRTILALGKSLKLQVVAEGVETPAQAQLLAEHGCDVFQGYLFARPCAAADIVFDSL